MKSANMQVEFPCVVVISRIFVRVNTCKCSWCSLAIWVIELPSQMFSLIRLTWPPEGPYVEID